VDSGSRVLITMDAYYRGGNLLDHKAKADIAVRPGGQGRPEGRQGPGLAALPGQVLRPDTHGGGPRFFVNDVLKDYYGARVEPEPMPAEAPLFLMYTSGTTGKPKGCQHGTGGYLAYVGRHLQIRPGHPSRRRLLVHGRHRLDHGPLLHRLRPAGLCASIVIYEGVPTYPDAGRSWRIAQDLDVNIFHTAPTAIRALRKIGPDEPAKYNYHFKHMTTVGEPIEPEVWKWY
jgi:acetyl-CoA synthetase